MTDRGVTFSAAMVLAMIGGRKTQTRRLASSPLRRCIPGDRLYVREHWSTMRLHDKLSPTKLGEKYQQSVYRRADACPVIYLADAERAGQWADDESPAWCPGKHRQAMHMPRWASRITLTITDVRVEPLQAISEADAKAEGTAMVANRNYRAGYAVLWNSLHADEGTRWDDNPEVLMLAFSVALQNIDKVPA